mmetsp:Transcript_1694/g.3385  ORF Transcript_1694/g.3385 Transcript_1694/m.3385 type:complete len:323 (-) Transcript_1694:125-1093(-)
MLTANEIVLQYVCPLFGCLAANFMFTAPVRDVREAVRKGTLGSLNPTPWAVMTGNCTGWVTYSYLIQNQFVFWANAPGFIVSVYLNMAAAKLQYCDRIKSSMRSSFVHLLDSNRRSFALPSNGERRVLGGDLDKEEEEKEEEDNITNQSSQVQTFSNLRKMALDITIQKSEAPAPHEKVVVGVVTIWLAVISLLSFLKLNIEQWKLAVGLIVNINLCFFYGAPLSTIFTVLKRRDSSSIHRWTMLTNTMNSCFWTAFGFGIMDWFIIVPNGLGAILSFIQIFLRIVVPSREISSSSSAEVTDGDIEATKSAHTMEGLTENES